MGKVFYLGRKKRKEVVLMKKNIMMMFLISVLIIVSFSGCINNKSQEEYIQDWEKNSETMREWGQITAWESLNSWCVLNCFIKQDNDSIRHGLYVESGGDGFVTISFEFEDENASVNGEYYMDKYAIDNETWKIYTVAGDELRWIFHIFSDDVSANIKLIITKELEPFPSCLECKFQPIVKELSFCIQDKVERFL